MSQVIFAIKPDQNDAHLDGKSAQQESDKLALWLAKIDFSLFCSMVSMGVARNKLCHLFQLSTAQHAQLLRLRMLSNAAS